MNDLDQTISALESRLGEDDDLILSVLELAELADGIKPMRGDAQVEWSTRNISVLGTCGNCGFKWPVAHTPMKADRLAQIVTRMSICSRCGETELVFLSQVYIPSQGDRQSSMNDNKSTVVTERNSGLGESRTVESRTALNVSEDHKAASIFVSF